MRPSHAVTDLEWGKVAWTTTKIIYERLSLLHSSSHQFFLSHDNNHVINDFSGYVTAHELDVCSCCFLGFDQRCHFDILEIHQE